jgi:hypothetical protein
VPLPQTIGTCCLRNNRDVGPGQDMLPFELLQCTSRLKQVALECINGILTGEALPPRSWLGGLVRFLLKKEDVFDTGGYRPVCLLDTIYKCLSAI